MGRPLAAVVLAGGASRRMGRDKATMRHPVDSQTTMVQHCVALVSTRCAPVFVVAAPGQRLPVLDATILRDEVPGLGPLAAAGLGLRAAAEAGVDRAFVCAVDMPHLTGELIDLLAADRGGDIVLPWDGREHYLAGVYRTALAGRVDELIKTGARSMRSLTDGVVTRRVAAADPRALTNINTPDDLHRPNFRGDGCG